MLINWFWLFRLIWNAWIQDTVRFVLGKSSKNCVFLKHVWYIRSCSCNNKHARRKICFVSRGVSLRTNHRSIRRRNCCLRIVRYNRESLFHVSQRVILGDRPKRKRVKFLVGRWLVSFSRCFTGQFFSASVCTRFSIAPIYLRTFSRL